MFAMSRGVSQLFVYIIIFLLIVHLLAKRIKYQGHHVTTFFSSEMFDLKRWLDLTVDPSLFVALSLSYAY